MEGGLELRPEAADIEVGELRVSHLVASSHWTNVATSIWMFRFAIEVARFACTRAAVERFPARPCALRRCAAW